MLARWQIPRSDDMVSAKVAANKAVAKLTDVKNANDSKYRRRLRGDTLVDVKTVDDKVLPAWLKSKGGR
jgi:hypothetical protein